MIAQESNIHDEDPIAEVRQWRAALYRNVGGTLEGLIALLGERGPDAARETSSGSDGRDAQRKKSA